MNEYTVGTVCSKDSEEEILKKIVEATFRPDPLDMEDPELFVIDVYKKYYEIRKFSDEKVNLLFYKQKLFINRFCPLVEIYEGIEISKNKYVSNQGPEVLYSGRINNKILKGLNLIFEKYNEVIKYFDNNKENLAKGIWSQIMSSKFLSKYLRKSNNDMIPCKNQSDNYKKIHETLNIFINGFFFNWISTKIIFYQRKYKNYV